MKCFYKISELQEYLQEQHGKSLGFVPTMGALHKGHLQLVEKSLSENDITVVSIFVNPIQFNDPKDYELYPVTIDKDIAKLTEINCDVVFIPDVDEMYPEDYKMDFDFGYLEQVLEGKFRPGHFKGVGKVVFRLFDIVKPDNAYFGKKDYQQLAIIKKMVKDYNLPVNIIPCPTVRENDGLAMSSRNVRLSPEERNIAPEIYKILKYSSLLVKSHTVKEVEDIIKNKINSIKKFNLEYFEIVDAETFKKINQWDETDKPLGCIALFLGSVRLIDNIEYF
ncbi:MAG: pantoate--beta-alanine ligase [Marinilabiliales bacterium]